MTRFEFLVLASLGVVGLVFSQSRPAKAPIASNPKVEIKGRIQKVQASRGQGAPYLEVKEGEATTRVILGSIRYLMEQEFNPKAGTEVVVKGYKTDSGVVAVTVTLPAEGKVLQLRDADGWPLWQGGRFGRAGRGQP